MVINFSNVKLTDITLHLRPHVPVQNGTYNMDQNKNVKMSPFLEWENLTNLW